MNDWRGTEVGVGDLVVYPGRQGSHMWMVEAEVVELVPGNPNAESYWDRTPHALRVKRLRESGGSVESKLVLVKLSSVVVVVKSVRFFEEQDIEIDGRAI
jgi:hypothetical protein